jgi:FkbH-like protein
MSVERTMLWREPLSGSWRADAQALTAVLKAPQQADLEAAGDRLRRLASMRVGDGERLQLTRLVKRARALSAPLPGFRRFRLLMVSNRTTHFLGEALEAAGAARGLLIEAVETPFDSIRALALNPAFEPPAGPFDAVLLLADAYFLQGSGALLDAAQEAADTLAARDEIVRLVEGLRGRIGAPVIAANLPTPPEFQLSSSDVVTIGAPARFAAALNCALSEAAERRELIHFDLAALAGRIGTETFFDPVRLHQAKTPFSLEATAAVADHLAALIAAMTGRAGRVLVLDLDNTLWGGVVSDDGLHGLMLGQGSALGEAFLAVQAQALELRKRGVLLAVCSKNQDEIAREPFRKHPDMLLREEHISVFEASFDDKALAITRIAQRLGLDPSSLVFVDDNPAERERVRSALPRVMVPELGDDPAYFARTLAACGFFEHLPLTAEDTGRAVAYEGRAASQALQALAGDYQGYLSSLEMELSLAPFDVVGRARIAQLIQKSNQFNLTTKRYSEIDVAAIEADAARIGWQVRLKDRFADHGMISVLVVDRGERAWSIDSWLMSCRVLERGVEVAIMGELAQVARRGGASELIGAYRPTPRNALVKDLYAKLGFEAAETQADGTSLWRLDLSRAQFEPQAMRIAHHGGEPGSGRGG